MKQQLLDEACVSMRTFTSSFVLCAPVVALCACAFKLWAFSPSWLASLSATEIFGLCIFTITAATMTPRSSTVSTGVFAMLLAF
eukprot:2008138-Pleurochrysis_carterae.AAC.3